MGSHLFSLDLLEAQPQIQNLILPGSTCLGFPTIEIKQCFTSLVSSFSHYWCQQLKQKELSSCTSVSGKAAPALTSSSPVSPSSSPCAACSPPSPAAARRKGQRKRRTFKLRLFETRQEYAP